MSCHSNKTRQVNIAVSVADLAFTMKLGSCNVYCLLLSEVDTKCYISEDFQ